MSDNILILHPRDARHLPGDHARLASWLEEVGFVQDGRIGDGDNPPGRRHTFRTGPAFERLLLFRNEGRQRQRAILDDVSEGAKLIDPADFVGNVCSVVIVGPLDREWFLGNGNTDDPTCVACGEKADWNQIATEWYEAWTQPERADVPEVACSRCRSRHVPWAFDWQGTAAFARFYIEVWHVHEGEASPSQALLDGLARASGNLWTFLYYRL